ncbi:MAG: MBL fold metallo-hydrolase [Gemmatimonadetes bacterium]|nr:MAG: MBL fold metallo-hydrolase [Gemmatimonadota bacterium]
MDRRAFLAGLAGLGALGRAPYGGAFRPDGDAAPPADGLPKGGTARPAGGRPGPYALVLGSAQDGGMPQAGCYAERCERARAHPRLVTSLALIAPEAERVYLMDATPDLRAQMDLIDAPGFRARAQARRPFDGIFLTHAHIGHYLGLALLGRESLAIRPTRCFCTPAMQRMLRENAPWSLLVDEGRLTFPEVPLERWFDVDGVFEARMLPVPHRPEFSDTVAFEVRGPRGSVLYLPDIDAWEAWDRDVREVVDGVDVALLDGAFYSADEVPGRRVEDIPHPLVPHTMALLQDRVRAGRRVVFTHMNNTNPMLDDGSVEAAHVRGRGFEIARAGMRIEL